MKRTVISLTACLGALSLSSCSGGEAIPKESADTSQGQEEIVSPSDAAAIDDQALSIKEAAAQAVKIIENDAQAEIDAIEAEAPIAPNIDLSSQEDQSK